MATIDQNQQDEVNHPSHYTDGKIEVIDFIEDKKLNFHLGNTVKYIARAGKKDPAKYVQDLEKAAWYLNRFIDKLKESNSEANSERVAYEYCKSMPTQITLDPATIEGIRDSFNAEPKIPTMQDLNFMELCLKYPQDAPEGTIDEYIDKYNAMSSVVKKGRDLYQYLGMTETEYTSWNKDPFKYSLQRIVSDRRAKGSPIEVSETGAI